MFKNKLKKKEKTAKPKSPSDLFRNFLKKDKTSNDSPKHLWSHQDKLLESYLLPDKYSSSDVVIEMPTGSGKTLVGLLVAEYRRVVEGKRVIYLCPTKQLAHQVAKQAKEIGIETSLLVGKQRDYDQTSFNRYQSAKQIGVTSYASLFNTNPRISNPEIILCDDAHAADQYISSYWSMKVSAYENEDLFLELKRVLKTVIPKSLFIKMYSSSDEPMDLQGIAELIPLQKWFPLREELVETIKDGVGESDLSYKWSTIQNGFLACNIYVSQDSFLIKPIYAPVMEHSPFSGAVQRIYMSATLGLGGDLERIFGVKNISAIPIPEDWDKVGIGRRFILFTNAIEDDGETIKSLAEKFGRSLFLLKSFRELEDIESLLGDGFTFFGADDIENGMTPFSDTENAVLMLAGRYDGIDLKGDACRLLYLSAIPTFNDLEERFFSSKLKGNAHLREKIRTRITQAVGRCTRDENDYSMICINDENILSWLNTDEIVSGIHPELQAEIKVGLELSEELDGESVLAMADAFLEQSDDWHEVEDRITEELNEVNKVTDRLASRLKNSSKHEVDFVYAMWTEDYVKAFNCAQQVVTELEGNDVEFRPYRAFWNYLGTTAAFMQFGQDQGDSWKVEHNKLIDNALSATKETRWLPNVKLKASGISDEGFESEVLTDTQVIYNELVEMNYQTQKFNTKLNELESWMKKKKESDSKKIEKAVERFGKLLGLNSKNFIEKQGAPDGVWVFPDNTGFVFELKSNKEEKNSISLEDIRECKTHAEWILANDNTFSNVKLETILVTNQTKIKKEAHSVAKGIFLISVDDLIAYFLAYKKCLEEIRGTVKRQSLEFVHIEIERSIIASDFDHKSIRTFLTAKKVIDLELE